MKPLATLLAAALIVAGSATTVALAAGHQHTHTPTVAQLAARVATLEKQVRKMHAAIVDLREINSTVLVDHAKAINCLEGIWSKLAGYTVTNLGGFPAADVLLGFPASAYPTANACFVDVGPLGRGASQPTLSPPATTTTTP